MSGSDSTRAAFGPLTLASACAMLVFCAGCRSDDPVSVLEVTSTVHPTVASIAHDTLGVQVIVLVHNPLDRVVRVVIRPGRRLTGGQLSMLGEDAQSSFGMGFMVVPQPLDSLSVRGFVMLGGGLPEGKTFVFEPGQILADTFQLGVRPDKPGEKPALSTGHFLIRGSWNTQQAPGVEIEVTP